MALFFGAAGMVIAMFLWWELSMVGILWGWETYGGALRGTDWDAVVLLFALLGPIAVPMLGAGIFNACPRSVSSL